MGEKMTAGDLAERLEFPLFKVREMVRQGCPCERAETDAEPLFDWDEVQVWLRRHTTDDTVVP